MPSPLNAAGRALSRMVLNLRRRLRRPVHRAIAAEWAPRLERLFAGREFSSDWASGNIPYWVDHLGPHRGEIRRVLEVGTWEGRSAVFFLDFFPEATVTCVDTFGGGIDNHGNPTERVEIPFIESRFDANVAAFGDRAIKIKSRSLPALDRLAASGERYDLIYVDGSHERDDVMIDSLLCWRLLRPGGFMIFDDYRWSPDKPAAERPAPAIDAFLDWYADDLVELHRRYQVIVRRKG